MRWVSNPCAMAIITYQQNRLNLIEFNFNKLDTNSVNFTETQIYVKVENITQLINEQD